MRVSTSIILSFFILMYVTSKKKKPYSHQQINGNIKTFIIAIQFFELLPKIVLKIILMIIEKF